MRAAIIAPVRSCLGFVGLCMGDRMSRQSAGRAADADAEPAVEREEEESGEEVDDVAEAVVESSAEEDGDDDGGDDDDDHLVLSRQCRRRGS